jgi:hypothetical protein
VVQSNQGSKDDVLVYKHQEPHHHLLSVNQLRLLWRHFASQPTERDRNHQAESFPWLRISFHGLR